MFNQFKPALLSLVFLTIVTGLLYPLGMTLISQSLFPSAANGSLIAKDGRAVGSALIGQSFTSDRYFRGRPSAAGKDGYDATSSGGSNLGPTSKTLIARIERDAATLRQENPTVPIPADLVTTSASGLDPDISPEAAYFQVPRVAKARGMEEHVVHTLVTANIKPRQFGFMGESTVNVLELNMALDIAQKS